MAEACPNVVKRLCTLVTAINKSLISSYYYFITISNHLFKLKNNVLIRSHIVHADDAEQVLSSVERTCSCHDDPTHARDQRTCRSHRGFYRRTSCYGQHNGKGPFSNPPPRIHSKPPKRFRRCGPVPHMQNFTRRLYLNVGGQGESTVSGQCFFPIALQHVIIVLLTIETFK